jgi:ATP-dependent Lon protease
MVKEKLFFRSDEDTDFMPIIPINENDSEQDKNIVIPIHCPFSLCVIRCYFPGVFCR